MENGNPLSSLADQPALDAIAEPLSAAVRGVYEAAGPLGRQAKNALHGVWLRHPPNRADSRLAQHRGDDEGAAANEVSTARPA